MLIQQTIDTRRRLYLLFWIACCLLSPAMAQEQPEGLSEQLRNRSFEEGAKILGGTKHWSGLNLAQDKRICKSELARSEKCAFKFTANQNSVSKLWQIKTDSFGMANNTLALSVWAKADNLSANVSLKVIVTYYPFPEKLSPSVITLKFDPDTYEYTQYTDLVTLKGGVKRIRTEFKVLKGKGKLYVDDVSLLLNPSVG